MSYTSPGFWLFLALALAGVAAFPRAWRVPWLIVMSLWFYAAADPVRLVWLGGVAGLTLVALHLGDPRRRWLASGMAIVALVAILVWAKFADAAGLPDPKPPPGLSFYIFTAIALLAEAARRGEVWGLRDSVLHLSWFPKLLAGPIERPQVLVPQFAKIGLRPGLAALGVSLLLSGLVKKLVIADNLAPVVDAAFAIPDYATPINLLIASYFFAFQIYCDFSGYADIAMGLSALVGLRLSRNFARPYLAPTVTEFWTARWHITLSRWFRDFVYFPLGGSRRGWLRRVVNLMTVFVLSGLWHAGLGYGVGWGFLVWGAMNGAMVCVEAALPDPRRAVSRAFRAILTFHLILVTWVFFRAASPADALTILRRVGASLAEMPHLVTNYPFTMEQAVGASLIAALLVVEIVSGERPLAERLTRARLPVRWAGWYAAMALLLLGGRWNDTTFIYAGF